MERVARAWATPLPDLNCAQYRLLIGQRFGLEWLAEPAARFVARYPLAACDLYPGDLTVNLLIAWREIAAHAPEAMRSVVALDLGWMARGRDSLPEGDILHEAMAGLAEARRVVGS
nr:contact-dependent growth inhibition system immunity protein [Sphingomonas sp. R-74633]